MDLAESLATDKRPSLAYPALRSQRRANLSVRQAMLHKRRSDLAEGRALHSERRSLPDLLIRRIGLQRLLLLPALGRTDLSVWQARLPERRSDLPIGRTLLAVGRTLLAEGRTLLAIGRTLPELLIGRILQRL